VAADPLADGEVWLDLTRTLTRAGRGAPTGIDRVELAWFDHLAVANPRLRCLCRTTRGFLLLPADAGRSLADVLRGQRALGRADPISRLAGRGMRPRHRAEAMVRPHAIDRCPPWGLPRLIARHRPALHVSVGHTGLERGILAPLAAAGTGVVVMIHDLIPVTHPQLGPPGQAMRFAEKLASVADHAAQTVVVSQDTRRHLEAHWRTREARPPIVAAPIGVPALPMTDAGRHEPGRFLMIGTIEPRKNQSTMLKAWTILSDRLAPGEMPVLHIVGNPGWQGDALLREIEGHPLFGRAIFRHEGAHDSALADHMARADALLYPSLAEGFGLPPWEALDHGVLPICADLPVLRELLGQHAVYLDPTDAYSWAETIEQRMSGKIGGPGGAGPERPSWDDHFRVVSAALAAR
jgi:glycosyltransferase involved in cell wall biosynthesis